jgi:hypothetical protein
MRLDLNASAIAVENSQSDVECKPFDGQAGHITTYEALGPSAPAKQILKDAQLRPISPAYHDTLSQLDFGDGNLKNAIFAVSPDDPQAEALLAVVSLKSDEGVDVRLIRPGLAGTSDDLPEGRRPIYAIFPLTKQPGTCGF